MKTRILVYGDSNTWGDPGLGKPRFATEQQWPHILQAKLGDDYEVMQEGLRGRISGDHDDVDLHRNGHRGYEIAIRTAAPLSYVVVALGSNDAKAKYGLSIEDIVQDLLWYGDRTRGYATEHPDEMHDFKKVLYLGMANFQNTVHFDPPKDYPKNLNSALVDSGSEVIVPGNLQHGKDGLHYTAEDHEKVAQLVYERLKEEQ